MTTLQFAYAYLLAQKGLFLSHDADGNVCLWIGFKRPQLEQFLVVKEADGFCNYLTVYPDHGWKYAEKTLLFGDEAKAEAYADRHGKLQVRPIHLINTKLYAVILQRIRCNEDGVWVDSLDEELVMP